MAPTTRNDIMCQNQTHAHHHTHDHASAHAEAPAGSIHGHVLLKWLADTPLSTDALRTRVAEQLGAEPRFHTCDKSGLSLDALLALLSERGKIALSGSGWSSDLSKMCSDA
jgi:probable metal-binding protein